MQTRPPLVTVSVFIIAALLTAGCAKQEVVRKDEAIAPTTVSRQIDQPNSYTTSTPETQTPVQTRVTPSEVISVPAASDQGQNVSSSTQLQSALEKIYFNFDSADLSSSARNTLSQNAAQLIKQSDAAIRIEGNCDERGSGEYNMALGERRAKAAKQYLITLGVESQRLSVVSYGNEKPAVLEKDEAGWAKNRRAEFVVELPVTVSAK
jgi:peptidoglycan-associated lipoprotein